MKKIFLIIVLAVAGALGAWAQKAEVESFEVAPMDLTAQKYARKDLHGEKCAVVKVRVIADGVAFQGNLIGEPVEKPGEYWVYLTDGTKQFQILSRSFLPFMYNFDEPLKGGVTYVLTLLAPQPAPPVPQKKKQNFLVLKVTPSTAHVTVDGAELPLENGIASKLLPAGSHAYRVTAPGYAPHEETVTIGEDKVSRTVTLRSVKPRLTVTTTTPGTEIFINEISRGTISATGYNPATLTATVSETAPATLTGALTPKPTDPYADDIALTDEYVLFKDYYSTGKYGYKHKGRVVIPAKYDDAWPFSEGLALVEINGKYGFIDKTDTIVIPAKYDDAGSFSEGLAWVEINGKYGFIDKTDTIVIPAKYDYATDFIEGLARVVIDGKYGFIDKTGTVVIPAKYDYAWPFSSGKAQVWLNGRQFFIDRNGNEVQ